MNASESTPPVSNKLKMPEGVAPAGIYMDMTEAYVKSVIAIPALLSAAIESLNDISDSLYVLSVYLEKKGIADGTMTEEDLDRDDEDGKDQPA